MSLTLTSPVLDDYAYIARRMRADEVAQYEAFTGRPYLADACALAAANTYGPAYLYLDEDGRPALIGGFDPIRPGVYEGWHMATADSWAKHWFAFTRRSRRLMADLFAAGAHRIQTCALASRTQAHYWYVDALGMKCEGVLSRYCADGSDAVMFSRTAP